MNLDAVNSGAVNSGAMPIAVDLDGTLIRTDLLMESTLRLLKKNPLYIFLLPYWLLTSKAHLKSEIAARTEIDITVLPYNEELLAYLTAQREVGRQIVLATASHEKFAEKIAAHLGIFSHVLASTVERNLKSAEKAGALDLLLGKKGYVYAGNESADLEVWDAAAGSIVVSDSESLLRQAQERGPVEAVFALGSSKLRGVIKACRLHQWVKNSLIFVPVLTAHQYLDPDTLIAALIAFLAFGLCASSVYLLNDLLDLDADRHHPTKKNRPFASGRIPVTYGLVLIPLILLGAIALSSMLPPMFWVSLAAYYVATTLYSFSLKKKIVLDVVILAGLFTARIISGAAATEIPLSEWLLLFSMFVFLSLALVKRYTELLDLRLQNVTTVARGRGYQVDDIELLASLGGASGYISVLVFALYLNSDSVKVLYNHPVILWAACPLLLYWISRMWILAHRGQMHDDPIVFATKDRVSILTGLAIGAVFFVASIL